MTVPLIRIGALRLGGEFVTALTGRRGCVVDRYKDRQCVLVEMQDGSTLNLHCDIKVRPVETIH